MMTDAPPRETGRLLRLAVPVIFTSVGNMLMGLVDTMVVGQHSSLALAGVAAGHSIFITAAMIGVGFLGAMEPMERANPNRLSNALRRLCSRV
jgi:MATE family multidrug resistance protein